jgi:hypothetical protein
MRTVPSLQETEPQAAYHTVPPSLITHTPLPHPPTTMSTTSTPTPSATQSSICVLCTEDEGARDRIYAWDYRPRAKDEAKGHIRDENSSLIVNLCGRCHKANEGTKLIGWDWWDAIDYLTKPPPQQPSEIKCHCGKHAATPSSTGGMMCLGCYREHCHESYHRA